MTPLERRHLRNGLLFASPWIVGLCVFMAYPIISSLYFSFCDYSTLQSPVWIGTTNYSDLFADDIFYKSLRNTVVFAFLSLPGSMVTALFLALLLNSGVRGLTVFRTIFYLPCLVPAVASAMLWLWIFNGDFGILNYALNSILKPLDSASSCVATFFLTGSCDGFFADARPSVVSEGFSGLIEPIRMGWAGPTWLGSPLWAKPALAVMSIWGVGGTMVIYLAGLQDVPRELYEAAEIDGAGWWRRLLNVTLPSISPVLYFTLIIGIIGSLQIFTPAYIMGGGTSGNPAQSTLFYALYLWAQAFEYLKMGYGCAMAWILFIIIVALTLIAHKTAGKRVTYAG